MIQPEPDKKAIHPIAIFKEGFTLWRKNFLSLNGIYLIMSSPFIVLLVFFPKAFVVGGIFAALQKLSEPDLATKQLIVLSAIVLVNQWAFVALAGAVNKIANGESRKVLENIGNARKRFLPYLGTEISRDLLLCFVFIISCLCMVLLAKMMVRLENIILIIIFISLIPIIGITCLASIVYFVIRLSLGSIISVVETGGPIRALKRSHHLIKRYVTPAVGVYCLFLPLAVISYFPELSILIPGKRQINALGYICQYGTSIIFTTLFVSIQFILYKHLKEAVDIKPVTGNQLPETR